MVSVIIVMLVVCIGGPLFYAWRLWRLHENSRLACVLAVVDACLFVALVSVLGRWDMAGWYLRPLVLGLFAAAVLTSLHRHASLPWRGREALRIRWATLLSAVLLASALGYAASGLHVAHPRLLQFPLREGRFIVGQGGDVPLLNHHATHPEQRHAADITALNVAGFRATGLLPRTLESYAIFGARVVSPCAGTVVAVRDGLPDLPPPETDRANPAGNHVIIECDGLHVELAHLRQHSVRVAQGQRLAAGEDIARVGNSGNTTEPHLHVHAVDPRTQTGVALAFGDRTPVRNRLFVN